MLKTTYVLLSEVAEADINARDHSDGDPDLEASIKRFGFIDPTIRDDRTGKLIDGHGRLGKLRQFELNGGDPPDNIQVTAEGWKIPVITGWASRDDNEAEAAAVAVQPKDGRYNEDALYKILHRQNDLTGLGFGNDDLDDLRARLQETPRAPSFSNPGSGIPPDPLASPATRPPPNLIQHGPGETRFGGGDGSRVEPTLDERYEDYKSRAIRSIVLDYSLDDYEQVTTQAAKLRADRGIASNAALFAALLAEAVTG